MHPRDHVDNTEPQKPSVRSNCEKKPSSRVRCLDTVRKHHTQCRKKWILDDCWMDIVNEQFNIPTDLKFLSGELNRAVGGDPRFGGIIDSAGESDVNGAACKASNMLP
jgi:hypothetical protein